MSLYTEYLRLGPDYPTFDDLPTFREFYKEILSEKEPRANYGELRGWLHYEHGLALQNVYPERAQSQLWSAIDTFKGIASHPRTSAHNYLGLTGAATLINIARNEAAGTPDRVPSPRNHAIELCGLLRQVLFDNRVPYENRVGQMAEVAVSAVFLLPGATKLVPQLATKRQERAHGMNGANTNRDINVVQPDYSQGYFMVGDVTPVQVKASHKNLLHEKRKRFGADPRTLAIYDPSIRLIFADQQLGLLDAADYQNFINHLARFVDEGDTTDYLEAARGNVIAALSEPSLKSTA